MQHVVIVGNGIAGITAARHIRKQSNHRITVISAESTHFWSRTALMYIYMGHMTYAHTKPYEDSFWEKNDIELIHDFAEKVDTGKKTIRLKNGGNLSWDQLILATGSRPNFFGWEGQDLKGVTGMVSLQDLERIEEFTKNISRGVIVGGGLIGIELAEMLRSRNIPVTFLVREKAFWNNILPLPEANMISRHIREHHVDLKLETELNKINGDASGRVKEIVTSSGETIPCEFVGITAGVSPNIKLAKASAIPTSKGILVNEYLETEIPGVFAIGDCAERTSELPGRRPVEQVWYTGRMMGETVAMTITGNRTAYQPGPWFNSAKFFDIEYQTYGNVPADTSGLGDFYWEHDNGRIALHVVFDEQTGTFLGINTFGMRLRHELFDQWLHTNATVEQVMSRLNQANFDPEFFRNHSGQILAEWNEKFPDRKVTGARKKILGFI